jgi:uncharacterized protein YjbJ (UPF0337 family)
MNKSRLKGLWNQAKGNVRQRGAQGTGDNSAYGRGQDERIIGETQSAFGRLQDRVKNIFRNP